MTENILNAFTIIAFAFFTIENLMQLYHVYKRKSSWDISILSLYLRLIGINIICFKLFLVWDIFLITGQVSLAIISFVYLGVVLYFRKDKRIWN